MPPRPPGATPEASESVGKSSSSREHQKEAEKDDLWSLLYAIQGVEIGG